MEKNEIKIKSLEIFLCIYGLLYITRVRFQIHGQKPIFSVNDSWPISYLHKNKGKYSLWFMAHRKKIQIDYDLIMITEIFKFLEVNIGENLLDFGIEKDFLNRLQKPPPPRLIGKLDFIKILKFFSPNDIINWVRMKNIEWNRELEHT